MALIDRLAGINVNPDVGPQKIPYDPFHSALYELAAGQLTKAQIISLFELDALEQSELDWLIAQYNAQPNSAAKEQWLYLLRVCFVLAEQETPGYTTNAELSARLTA